MSMLVLSSSQVRRSTRQGRLVTVACHCISRPLTWARSWQGGRGGRTAGAEAQMPPDLPTHGPKPQALTDLGKTEGERKGFGSSRPFGDQGQFGCPGRIAIPSIHLSVYGFCQCCIACLLGLIFQHLELMTGDSIEPCCCFTCTTEG